jgi:hypothetical protein
MGHPLQPDSENTELLHCILWLRSTKLPVGPLGNSRLICWQDVNVLNVPSGQKYAGAPQLAAVQRHASPTNAPRSHTHAPPPLYSASQATSTASPVTPTMLPAADLSEFATSVASQAAALQLTLLNAPLASQVAVPLPVYPASQVTATASPVTPVMLPATALSEFATCVAAQSCARTFTVWTLARHTTASSLATPPVPFT